MVQTEREYAEALFSVAAEEDSAEEYLGALHTVKQVIYENPDYIEFLASPAISMSERAAAIDEAFGVMPEYVVSFIKLLCESGRVRSILECIDEYEKLATVFLNRTTAFIYSAVKLSETQKSGVCAKLEKLTGKTVEPVYIIDESLIGGVKIEVDGKTLDGSVKYRMGEIKDVMNS
ncbi:MAG: ATP synthase F1 subunit delta [Clostridia bacterium]|nr:ATP synthase F1 subunit delta [Clostridia bacterium]MBR3817826.1 ATP synthase F1 subunit delta [Clostridia bacterium]